MACIEKKIKIISIDQPFLHTLAQYLFEQHQDNSPDFSNILVIFPTQRNKLYFRRYLLDVSGAAGIIPPVMKSIAELVDILYENTGGKKGLLLNTTERNFILKKVVQALKVEHWDDLPFLKFIAVGKRLLYFFDELSKEQLDFARVDELIRVGHYPEKFVKEEISIIKDIYNGYRKAITDLGYHDIIDKCRVVLGGPEMSSLELFQHIYISGLVATTSLENSIIHDILHDFSADLIIHSGYCDPKPAADPTTPFYLHAKMLRNLGVKSFDNIGTIGENTSPVPVVNITRTKSMFQQTLHIKDILRKASSRYEPHRIAVVLTDEKCLYPVIDILKSSGLNYNLSAGLPLPQAPLYTFLMQLLDVVESGFHHTELSVFLKHPLNKNAVVQGRPIRPMVYMLAKLMVKERLNYFHFEEHRTTELQPLIELLKRYRDVVVQEVSYRQYIMSLIEILNEIISYNSEFLKASAESIGDFFDRLNDLGKLRLVPDIAETGIRMLRFVLDILKDETFRTMGDPMKGVQVIGILESRNLDFDCIILPSMNEGIFPRRSEKDLFVNQQVRKELGLPYDKERESLYHYYYSEMISGKKEVFISYIEEEKRDIRSRFIDFQVDKGAVVNEVGKKLSSSAHKMKIRSVRKSSDLFKKLIHKLTKRGLSPTNLKNYRECPYRFYLRYLLGIKEPEAVVEEADYMEWGRIVHRALCDFYKYDVPEGLTTKSLNVLKLKLHQRLDNAMRKELAQSPKMTSFLDLEIYKKRMDKFLDYEKERSKTGYTVLTDRIEEQINYSLSVNNVKVKLYGYPDRIERENDRYNILDYKMTIPSRKKYEVSDEFIEFQLPLYGMIISKGDFSLMNNLAYYGISRDIKLCNVADGNNVAEYLSDFKSRILQPTIEEMLSPEVPFCQTCTKASSKYCPFTALCGVANG